MKRTASAKCDGQKGKQRKIDSAKAALTSMLMGLKRVMGSTEVGRLNRIDMRWSLDKAGVCVVPNAFTPEALMAARAEARSAFMTDIAPQLEEVPPPEMPLFEITKNDKYWKTGVIGNKDFGYLFSQPDTVRDFEIIRLSSGKKITVAMGGGWKANLALLAHPSSKQMLDTMFEVTGNNVVSADSCKIHRGGMTAAHVDIYGPLENGIDRHQAIAFGLAEGTTRLCFLQFSNHPDVRPLVNELVERDIYANDGFSKVPLDAVPDLVGCFQAAGCIRFGCPRDLIMWESGVIHLEMNLLPSGQLTLAKQPLVKTTTERYLVGTHTMKGFTQRDMQEIAYMGHMGFFFHPYAHVQDKTAHMNSVHRKTTMYTARRVKTGGEIERLTRLGVDISGGTKVDEWVASADPALKKCFGI